MNPKSNLPLTFFIIIILSISLVHVAHASSFLLNFRKLARHGFSKVSLSPGGGPVLKLTQSHSFSPAPTPAPAPTGGLNEDKCSRCHDLPDLKGCLEISPTDPKEAFLFIKNDGEGPVKVNITVLHSKVVFSELEVPKHKTKKVKISDFVGGSPSIRLNAGNGNCIMQLGSSVSNGNIFKQFSIFTTQGAPIYGAYLVFLAALIIGVTWVCCKSRKSRLQGDGVPYQELEMGKPDTLVADDVKVGEGWEEGWDDDWDETKALKSPVARQVGNPSADGLNSRSSDTKKWKNNWND